MVRSILIGLFLLLCTCLHSRAQTITTIAGNGTGGVAGDGGQATAAQLLQTYGVAVDTAGNVYISTSGNLTATHAVAKVRIINTSGVISTFAGIDTVGFNGDGGAATAARIFNPNSFAFDKKGNIYIAEMNGNRRVRKVDPSGIITTFAGNGSSVVSGDGGPATAAGISSGGGICSDTLGNIYIAAGNKIRKVDTAGIITTFAGIGSGFYGGDGGPATAAAMTAQGQIAMDKYGNMYIAEGANFRVRKINTAGIITTIAGNGTLGYSGDGGPATMAQLNNVTGVFPDNCGNVYIADGYNNRIRMINGYGVISSIAGNGIAGYGGDNGPASAAQLNNPNFIYLDKYGNIYISDRNNARIRYIHMDSCKNTTAVPAIAASHGALRISPNPNNGTCSITLSSAINEPVQVVVTNILGAVVREITTTTNKEIEMKLDVPAGIYIVSVSTNERRYNAKMVVE